MAVLDRFLEFLVSSEIWAKLVRIALFFLLAWLVQRLSGRLAGRVVKFRLFSPRGLRPRPERESTLQSLTASAIRFVVLVMAALASLGQFVEFDTLVWMVGLFSAAFGLGARPLISDVLTGIGLIFEDTFSVGEKVEILGVEGVVEAVNLRTTFIRSPTGELYVMPNGEIRVVRNFSRGRFSMVSVTFSVSAEDLGRVLPLLEEIGREAVAVLPNLLEPWQVLSEHGVVGPHTELTLRAKARFGKAAEMRPRLLALVQDGLVEAGIALAG